MLASVGFQLSFLAVFGIVSMQKYFKQWFTFKYWISNEIWNIISVSIAAQLATFPLGLLYFHQFPVYFLASNLINYSFNNRNYFCSHSHDICSRFSTISFLYYLLSNWFRNLW